MKTQLISKGFGSGMFPLTEMLQHYGQTGRTGSFLITHATEQAKVYLVSGFITHAETAYLSGEEAMLEILTWNNPSYDWIDSETPQHMTMSSVVQDVLLNFIQLQSSGELDLMRQKSNLSSITRNIASEPCFYEMNLDISSSELRPFTFLIQTPQVRIGRHTDNDLLLTDSSISRKHAILIVSNDAILVRDLGSMNGISINGHLQTQGLLHNNDLLRIGEVNINVRICTVSKPAEAAAA